MSNPSTPANDHAKVMLANSATNPEMGSGLAIDAMRDKDVEAVLRGEKSIDQLNGDQQNAFFDAFGVSERNRTPNQAEAFALYLRNRHQVGYCGLDSDEIVTICPSPRIMKRPPGAA